MVRIHPLSQNQRRSQKLIGCLFLLLESVMYVYIYHSCSLAATPSPPSQLQVLVALSHVWDQLGGEELATWLSIMQLEAQPCTQLITCITLKNGLLKEHMMASLLQWWWCHHMHSWLLLYLLYLRSQWCTSYGCQTRPLYAHSTNSGPHVWMQWLPFNNESIEPAASVVSVVAMFCLLVVLITSSNCISYWPLPQYLVTFTSFICICMLVKFIPGYSPVCTYSSVQQVGRVQTDRK